jgi:G3E family GTPase
LPLPDADAAPSRAHRIATASIEITEPIPAGLLDGWIDALRALGGPDILRVKGIVHVEGRARPLVVHGVQHVFDAPVPLTSWSGEDRTSRIVMIARGMDQTNLQARLATLQQVLGDRDARGDDARRHPTNAPT